MEVKEAIEIIKNEFVDYQEGSDIQIVGESIISLLQQGEKYRKMWEETKNKYHCYCYNRAIDVMEILEEKHFPKEADREYPESDE